MRKILKQYSHSLTTYAANKEELSRLQSLLIVMAFTCLVILIITL